MIIAETKLTPGPAMRRPATKRPRDVDAVCRIQPIPYTMQPRVIVVRRPNQSARSPATREPKKVPAERIEMMSDLCGVGMTNAAVSAAEASLSGICRPVYKWIKYFKARTPLRGIVVVYPGISYIG